MSQTTPDIRIGQAVILFNEEGKAVGSMFTPEGIKINNLAMFAEVGEVLAPVEGNKGQENIRKAAETVFAAWFNKMNEIELADREKFEIVTEVLKCEEYSPGKVKSCTIAFIFREREAGKIPSAFSAN